jgi:hypothetical protein
MTGGQFKLDGFNGDGNSTFSSREEKATEKTKFNVRELK